MAAFADRCRPDGWTVAEVVAHTGWKHQCVSEWCRRGLLDAASFTDVRDDDEDADVGTAFDQCRLPPFPRGWRSQSGSISVLITFPKEGRPAMPDQTDYSGMAALSICEALLLAMNDHGLLPEREIMGVLQDAAATHENATGPDADKDVHEAVAGVINRIIAGGNSVRRP